mmetsp:Transcript_23119/g.54563  ORF Transcript_23119/g.54563 Transcript_23119/m.54563 type:complete len:123 (+) Transcript_23119:1491-1859(+)
MRREDPIFDGERGKRSRRMPTGGNGSVPWSLRRLQPIKSQIQSTIQQYVSLIDFNFSAEERQVSLSQVAWHSICPVVPGSTDLVFGMTSTGKDNIGVIARNEQLKSEMHPLPSSNMACCWPS